MSNAEIRGHLEVNPHEAVTWAYRLMLGREPESPQIVDEHVRLFHPFSIEALRQRFASSPEFTALSLATEAPRETSAHPGKGLFEAFRDHTPHEREQGFYRDIFGIKTRVSYLPAIYASYSGGLTGDNGLELLPMHDEVELSGMQEAGLAAVGQFTIMELGAGWGPWVSIGARMAQARGLGYRIIAVEGSEDHFAFLNTHIADNGFDRQHCRLVHGIVGAEDGVARFPKMADPSSDYGASLEKADTGTGEFEEVASYTIATLLRDEPIVDIIHCDIQGHEVEAIRASMTALCNQVRRIVVGTHGRAIEEQLYGLFSAHGWSLSKDMPCTFREVSGVPSLVQDGAQLWVNQKHL